MTLSELVRQNPEGNPMRRRSWDDLAPNIIGYPLMYNHNGRFFVAHYQDMSADDWCMATDC